MFFPVRRTSRRNLFRKSSTLFSLLLLYISAGLKKTLAFFIKNFPLFSIFLFDSEKTTYYRAFFAKKILIKVQIGSLSIPERTRKSCTEAQKLPSKCAKATDPTKAGELSTVTYPTKVKSQKIKREQDKPPCSRKYSGKIKPKISPLLPQRYALHRLRIRELPFRQQPFRQQSGT